MVANQFVQFCSFFVATVRPSELHTLQLCACIARDMWVWHFCCCQSLYISALIMKSVWSTLMPIPGNVLKVVATAEVSPLASHHAPYIFVLQLSHFSIFSLFCILHHSILPYYSQHLFCSCISFLSYHFYNVLHSIRVLPYTLAGMLSRLFPLYVTFIPFSFIYWDCIYICNNLCPVSR